MINGTFKNMQIYATLVFKIGVMFGDNFAEYFPHKIVEFFLEM